MDRLPQLWPLHTRLPPFGPALRFINLHHEEGQDHHGTQEGENRDGLAYLLVVAARHDPCRRQWGMLRKAQGPAWPLAMYAARNPHPPTPTLMRCPGLTSRYVPSTALPRRQGPHLWAIRPEDGQHHFVQVDGEQLLVLPEIASGTGREETNMKGWAVSTYSRALQAAQNHRRPQSRCLAPSSWARL